MASLTNRKCIPCDADVTKGDIAPIVRSVEQSGGNISPLPKEKIAEFMKQVSGWQLSEENNVPRIKKRFKFKDFKEAVSFVNKVAALAESEGHHPNIFIYYNKVDIELYTHAIKGLHDNDFIMAAKIDDI